MAQYPSVRQDIRNSEVSATIYLPLLLALPIRTLINPNVDSKSMVCRHVPPRHNRKRTSRIFRGFSSGPSCPIVGARGRRFNLSAGSTVTSISLQRPQCDIFWHILAPRNAREVPSLCRERVNAYARACQSRADGQDCAMRKVCGAIIGGLGRPWSTGATVIAEFRSAPLRHEAITWVERRSLWSKRVWSRTRRRFYNGRHAVVGAQGSPSRTNR
jgi:hypothetical protein